ncbi:prepilin-type N-terminal cleavage/methylation domain-containing protein [Candidatus Gracilibacteria bacterium]|nr:prepilin-type N-terminal cleavage/methylation domain-containing protein [Candidatus Gracilibacteria bacterium]
MTYNIRQNQKGFSLVEVMIAMMILTVSVVTATTFLTRTINANRNVVSNLQAYYYAVEGIEGVRNVRDTNWLHNREWLGADSVDLWGGELRGEFGLQLNPSAWGPVSTANTLFDLSKFAPFRVGSSVLDDIYSRHVTVTKDDSCEDCVLVEVRVNWSEGVRDRSVELKEILSNWQGIFVKTIRVLL